MLSGWTAATAASKNITSGAAYTNVNALLTGATDAITINGVNFAFTSGNTVQNVLDEINNANIGVTATLSGGAIGITSTAAGSSSVINITGTSTGSFTAPAGTVNGTDASINSSGTAYSATGNTITIQGGSGAGLQFKVNGSSATTASAASGASITVTNNGGLTLQIGANQGQTMYISIDDMRSTALGVNGLDMTTSAGAQSAITTVDNAISTVSARTLLSAPTRTGCRTPATTSPPLPRTSARPMPRSSTWTWPRRCPPTLRTASSSRRPRPCWPRRNRCRRPSSSCCRKFKKPSTSNRGRESPRPLSFFPKDRGAADDNLNGYLVLVRMKLTASLVG